MAKPFHQRSNYGCWTCRARKKKCDERYPICQACATREITCHGYGPKPAWMDGGQQEKGVLEELKHAIRDTRSQNRLKQRIERKRAMPSNTLRQDQSHQHLPSPPCAESSQSEQDLFSSPSRASLRANDSVCPVQSLSSPPTHRATYSPLDEVDPTQPARENSFNDKALTEGMEEPALLMHYLDTVFPLQFAMYVSTPELLGRGWLLALLMRTRPLKNIALALSACHMNVILQKNKRMRCSEQSRKNMEKYHTQALAELQLHIADLRQCRGDEDGKLNCSVEVLACILQLIYFELFRGSGENWQMHMQAASSVVMTLITDRETSQPFDALSATPLPPWCELKLIQASKRDYAPFISEISRDFFTGVFVYFDIIACATTRTGSFLPGSYKTLHGLTSSEIEMSRIVGCENWVLIAIAKISELDMRRKETGKNNEQRMPEPWFVERADEIRRVLTSGLERMKEGDGSMVDQSHCPPRNFSKSPNGSGNGSVHAITRVFASAALIYLHLVTASSSFSPTPTAEISSTASPITTATTTSIPAFCPFSQPTVPSQSHLQLQTGLQILTTRSITALRALCVISPTILRNVVWPFCVTGCIASLPAQRMAVEELVKGANPMGGDETVGDSTSACTGSSLGRAWEIIREAWRLGDACAAERDEGNGERWDVNGDGLDSVDVDWSMAMESLSLRCLLI